MKCVPDYLEKYAYDISSKKDKVTFKLKCTCGCQSFDVLNVGFFLKNGYKVAGELPDLPKGHSYFVVDKDIRPGTPEAE